MTDYKVALDVYHGPLDLLLFLIRREEIDIYDIPIARVTEQYLQYVELIGQLDPEAVSEFLILAATLMEIKSRMLLPKPPPEEGEEDLLDPRMELVRQLLEYKRFKDAARSLEGAAAHQSMLHARSPVLPDVDHSEIELENLQIWDLYDAFQKVLEQIGRSAPVHHVAVDDTPVTLHADDILDSLARAGGVQAFEVIFLGRGRGELIGLFLALLELIRQRRIRVSQERPFAPILIHLLDATPLDAAAVAANTEGQETAPFEHQPTADGVVDADEGLTDEDEPFEELDQIRLPELDEDFQERPDDTEQASG